MFITIKRHERERQELLGANNRITEAILKHGHQGLFLLDHEQRILPQVSRSLAALFRREDFADLSFEKLLAPLVSAKGLSVVRSYIAQLMATDAPRASAATLEPLADVEIRLPKGDGSYESAHYAFEFNPIEVTDEPRAWLVQVTDITQRVQSSRELEELRVQVLAQREILRAVLESGSTRFAALLKRTDASMKAINVILKKPAREQDAFRAKLEETLEEVDRVRRDAAALRLTALEACARQFEDSLHDLRNRSTLSGSDFLPLAVKLDHLYGQHASLKSIASSTPRADALEEAPSTTANGTQIIQVPRFVAEAVPTKAAVPGAYRCAPAGSLASTLQALTEHVAQEHAKIVNLDAVGLDLVPYVYQSAVKNIAIQLIRNAVMHGIEAATARAASGKTTAGAMRLEFRTGAEGIFELLFEDDGGGLDPEQVRATAIARNVVTGEAAVRLRDREAIKLIFKSGYSTLTSEPGQPPHGTGLSLVRRYVHEAGGKVALASLLGHETRFKISLPALAPDVPLALATSA